MCNTNGFVLNQRSTLETWRSSLWSFIFFKYVYLGIMRSWVLNGDENRLYFVVHILYGIMGVFFFVSVNNGEKKKNNNKNNNKKTKIIMAWFHERYVFLDYMLNFKSCLLLVMKVAHTILFFLIKFVNLFVALFFQILIWHLPFFMNYDMRMEKLYFLEIYISSYTFIENSVCSSFSYSWIDFVYIRILQEFIHFI